MTHLYSATIHIDYNRYDINRMDKSSSMDLFLASNNYNTHNCKLGRNTPSQRYHPNFVELYDY